nr:hypothetical protein [Tanacetum cinerariifolium]
TVIEVRVAMKAADIEFTRWEVQEREVNENALSILVPSFHIKSNKSLFKAITVLAKGMFEFYVEMNSLADYEKKKCNPVFVPISHCVDCFIEAFAWRVALYVFLGGLWLLMGSREYLSRIIFDLSSLCHVNPHSTLIIFVEGHGREMINQR